MIRENYRIKTRTKRLPFRERPKSSHESNWPTIDDMLETTQQERFATYNQILSGQGLYFGYETERFTENDIPIVNTDKEYALAEDDLRPIAKEFNIPVRLIKIVCLSRNCEPIEAVRYLKEAGL